ncbi:MAG: AraC family transcriptional regulator [Proteobacteria bacterium]|nr:AraC family transcriptional regulator [Pseudomonadota bacterium]
MKVSILTFEGFNELDSFIAFGILNRLRSKGLQVSITGPSPKITSMNGVTIEKTKALESASESDAVLFGSGVHTKKIAQNPSILNRIKLDPNRQLIGAQCSGTLLMAKLGLIKNLPACTDLTTKPWAIEAGVKIIDAPFYADKNLSTAGGCMSSQYLAAWTIAKLFNKDEAAKAIYYVAPVGQKEEYVDMVMKVVTKFL